MFAKSFVKALPGRKRSAVYRILHICRLRVLSKSVGIFCRSEGSYDRLLLPGR